MNASEIILWSAIAIGVAAVATWLINKLVAVVRKTLPQWTLAQAKERFAKIYPTKNINQVLAMFIQRDKVFSRMVDFLPIQCIVALIVLSAVWAWLIPASQSFWTRLVQNVFIFEVTLLAMVPAFRSLRKMQQMVIARVQELVGRLVGRHNPGR
ncbi:hypothetical protein K8S19_05660 [bacterium]|nr:hypothetical protein [bacterium]